MSQNKPQVNTRYYNPVDYEDVEHVGLLSHEELLKENSLNISRYCERLIRSGENSRFVLTKFLSKADLTYTNPKTGDNLLNIAILSHNFTPVDVLLTLGCDKTTQNNRGISAEDFSSYESCHRTIKKIFEKQAASVQVETVVENTTHDSTIPTSDI